MIKPYQPALLVLFALLSLATPSLSGFANAQEPAKQTAAEVPALALVVLGSGGPGAVGRASSAHLVLVDGMPRILVDAGPGSFVRLGETGLSLDRIDIQLLTHLHADHAGELPGLFKARAVAVRAPIQFQIFGPEGREPKGNAAYFPSTSRLIDLLFGRKGAFAYLPDFAGHISFIVTDLPTFSGDIDADGWDDLKKIAAGTTLLVFNAVVLDPPKDPPILYTLHSPPKAIGQIAEESKVHGLLLAHLSPETDQNRSEVEASIRKFYAGPITFASDKLRVEP